METAKRLNQAIDAIALTIDITTPEGIAFLHWAKNLATHAYIKEYLDGQK